MAAPTPYDRQSSFELYSAENPGDPHSGADLDIEFNAVKIAMDETQDNLALIQDADGAVARGSIGRAQLDSSITLGIAPPELWLTATLYDADVSVVFNDLILYLCLVDHTSGVFATDLAAGKWQAIADFSATAIINDGSITTAKLDDDAVTAAKLASNAVETAKILNGAVTTTKIADANVTTVKIADSNVTTAKIADSNVTTAKIADDNVTYAKLQNVSATSRILARKTAAAGNVEECTLAEILEFIGSSAQGDLLHRGAAAWARLAAGAKGKSLRSQGAAADLTWSDGGWVLLNTLTASVSATLSDTTSFTSDYAEYMLEFINLSPATDAVSALIQVHSGGVFPGTSYVTHITGFGNGSTTATAAAPTDRIPLTPTATLLQGNSAPGISGRAIVHSPTGTTAPKIWQVSMSGKANAPFAFNTHGGGYWNSNAAIDGFQFFFSAGNINTGSIKVYGRN